MCILTRDGNMQNAQTLAELVDNKLAQHYQLDESGKKTVRTKNVERMNEVARRVKGEPEPVVFFCTDSF